jgi:hypothetical protein
MKDIVELVRTTAMKDISEGDKVQIIAEAVSDDVYRALLSRGIDRNYLLDDYAYRAVEHIIARLLLHQCVDGRIREMQAKAAALEADIARDEAEAARNKDQRRALTKVIASWLPFPDGTDLPDGWISVTLKSPQRDGPPVATNHLVPKWFTKKELIALLWPFVAREPSQKQLPNLNEAKSQ